MEGDDVVGTEGAGMALAVEADEGADPVRGESCMR
jgi:hypothetical protein